MWEASNGVYLVFFIEKVGKLTVESYSKNGDTKGLEDLTLADIDFRVISQTHHTDRVTGTVV